MDRERSSSSQSEGEIPEAWIGQGVMIETTDIVFALDSIPSIMAITRDTFEDAWSWTPDGPELFRDVHPDRWERCGENPVRLPPGTPLLTSTPLYGDLLPGNTGCLLRAGPTAA
jgi:alpha-glucosidase